MAESEPSMPNEASEIVEETSQPTRNWLAVMTIGTLCLTVLTMSGAILWAVFSAADAATGAAITSLLAMTGRWLLQTWGVQTTGNGK